MSARLLLCVPVLCHAAESAAVTASGRNWQISIDRIECAAAALAGGLRIRDLGPRGPVEAPLSYLTDGKARDHAPRSLVWKAGAKQHAGWLSELPMGKAPAQPYVYAGLDELGAIEDAARRALAADFPGYGTKYFAFNWGSQRVASGNEVYSIGVYELRACPP